ncbi:PREDICTED: uncharacterized protein LOC109484810 [Branchiostoma belcheri]|uniref:Uncharacterized protein LOC109484810 n=1 Tax=Branchiostoma belcheri TaxID=7741 RepID=A0A6P4ZRA0_BRABE|nr:PREDICTED: uncharacterized protein LOC109484810 [Branchiostoma belcheri]
MRWHPLVIRWCLRHYRSNSKYEALSKSGFLRLPSGRTLRDYKNFSTASSGWHISSLQRMRETFHVKKIKPHGNVGFLAFDEVKIKEGLIWEPNTNRLVGFVDVDEIPTDLDLTTVRSPKSENVQCHEQVATHVMQFMFKSLFAPFSFPVAYFLTKRFTGVQINRMFWTGVGMLHDFGFHIVLSVCDGDSANRTFIRMNTGDTGHMCENTFSSGPIFFISGHEHYHTRCLRYDGKDIIWKHIQSVFDRDRKRPLALTRLTKQHVYLDNWAKMRVNLSVHTLSSAVQREMHEHENNATMACQLYTSKCNDLWTVCNSDLPLKNCDDSRMGELKHVQGCFCSGKEDLKLSFIPSQKLQNTSFHGKHLRT